MSAMEFSNSPTLPSSSLKGSWKYLSEDKLPRIDSGTSFMETYSQLTRSGSSGFLLFDKGMLQGYVKGHALAHLVVQQANGDPQSLRQYSAEQIGAVISKVGSSLVPVSPTPAGATEKALEAMGETVFRVIEPDGSSGWYLNHETIRDAATKKTVFICSKGHRNPDSDHGTCYTCPFPIVRTETE
jgi:hypothetical protein